MQSGSKRPKTGGYILAVAALLVLTVVAVSAGLLSGPATAPKVASNGPSANLPSGSQAGAQLASSMSAGERKTLPNGVTVIRDSYHDVSAPLRDMRPAPDTARQEEGPENEVPFPPATGKVKDPVVQRDFGVMAMPTPVLTFEGISNPTACGGCYPPDTNGDVGPNHYIQTVNLKFQIWDKNGTSLYGPVNTNTLWSGFSGTCATSNSGDPVVNYDPLADRWVISQFTTGNPYSQCVAVSQTGDPLGQWNRYQFVESTSLLYDYPKMGVWPDAYYMTANVFGNSYERPSAIAMDRARMLQGQSATMQEFNPGNFYYSLLPSDFDGLASSAPPAGAPNVFVSASGNNTNIHFWKFHVDWNNPANSSFTGPINVAGAPWDPNLCGLARSCIPQPGTAVGLDSLGDHMMFRLAYRNMGSYQTLVTNESVDENSQDHAGIRWYEFRLDNSGNPFIYQQGTFAPDANHRWMGSAAMDGSGNIAVGYSVSSSSLYPSIRYAGRLVTDPLGTLGQGEASLFEGSGSQTGSGSRWGDYSDMVVDPSDECTFWYTNEYYPVTSTTNWHTRIGKFRFPSCGQPQNTPTPSTPTATSQPTNTPVPVPTTCANYAVATATGTIVPGTTDIGNHCDDCATHITLPFPVNFYDRTFTEAYVSSNGVIEFNSSDFAFGNACIGPSTAQIFSYAVMAYWDDLVTNGSGQGIFTSVTGSAPNRIFNVEWRAQSLYNNLATNFEVRFYEGSTRVDVQYGTSTAGNGVSATSGLQKDASDYTQFSCNQTQLTSGRLLQYTLPPCETATPAPPTNTPVPPTSTPEPPTATPGAETPTPCAITFSDVPPENTFYPYVRCLACRGILGGYDDGTFRPNNPITRGQISKIVSNAAGWTDPIPNDRQTYTDVDPNHPFWLWIERATAHGIMSGYNCGGPGEPCDPQNRPYFRPWNNATRAQLAKIDSNAAGYNEDPTTQTFTDVDSTHPFYVWIERLATRGIMGGYTCGGPGEPCDPQNRPYFRPYNNVTRGQAAKIVANTFYPNCQTPGR